jgi:hypothetical protein
LNMERLAQPGLGCCVALAAVLWLGGPAAAQAQQGEPKADAKPESKGENFSAKPPAQLFASDCTGAGCHKGPQGLAKSGGIGLAGFLREHYTNSRESAAALANYLSKLPAGPEPKEKGKEKETRTLKPAPAASFWSDRTGFFSSGEKSDPREAKTPPKPNTRASRAPAKPEEETPDKPRTQPAAVEPATESGAKSRAARAHAPGAAATAAAPEPVPMPPQPPAEPPAAAPAPAAQSSAPPATTAPKQFDIFD